MFEALVRSLVGAAPVARCGWCRAELDPHRHCAPVPVCSRCFHRAYEYAWAFYVCRPCLEQRWATYLRGDPYPHESHCAHKPKDFEAGLWTKLNEAYPHEMRALVRREQQRPAASDLVACLNERTRDVLAMQHEAFRLQRGGCLTEAQALQQRIADEMAAIQRAHGEQPRLLADLAALEREDA
jgi:hypothetical protein